MVAVDLQSWKEKIEEDMFVEGTDDDDSSDPEEPGTHIEPSDAAFTRHEQYKNGVLTIGCCGE